MGIYEIDQQLQALIDPETGELLDYEAYAALQMEREQKVENTALWIKNDLAEADAIDAEIKALKERSLRLKARAERLKEYVGTALGGEKFETPRVVCRFQKSTRVEVDEQFLSWAQEHGGEYLRFPAPEINKTAIRAAIKSGTPVPHAAMAENYSLIIK